jgi:chromate transport protein ChrA
VLLGTVCTVVFMVGTIVLSVLVVVLTRGSFERLSRIRLRALWLLLVALVAQIALEFVDIPEERLDDLGYALLLGTYVLILVFCLINRRLAGMAIVTLGIALNVLVIALNQGMPTKDDVVERNEREVRVPIERTVKHRPEEPDDQLPFLGDVLSVPGIPNQQFSIGDVIIGIGVADICFEASRRPRRRGVYLSEAAKPA